MLYDPKWEKKIDTIPVADPEFKRKWIEALRSGKYRQARSALHRDGALCCIGVGHLCLTGSYPDFEETTRAVIDLGLNNTNANKLVNMNDSQMLTFREIADYIEKKL